MLPALPELALLNIAPPTAMLPEEFTAIAALLPVPPAELLMPPVVTAELPVPSVMPPPAPELTEVA